MDDGGDDGGEGPQHGGTEGDRPVEPERPEAMSPSAASQHGHRGSTERRGVARRPPGR